MVPPPMRAHRAITAPAAQSGCTLFSMYIPLHPEGTSHPRMLRRRHDILSGRCILVPRKHAWLPRTFPGMYEYGNQVEWLDLTKAMLG